MILDYNSKTKVELVSLCKKIGVHGYAQNGITKDRIIQLIKGELEYKDPRKKGNWSEKKKKSFEKALKIRQSKHNLFDYLTKNNSSIITRYVGNPDDLKKIAHSTMIHYKWKCTNYSECSNTFEARPRDVFRNDRGSPIKYCSLCKYTQRGIIYQQNILEKNGTIQTKIPDIIHVWCNDNTFKPCELTAKSHKIVKLRCPNRSARHPEYEIMVYNIQERNCVSCPKCSIKTSKAEMRIYSELKHYFNDVKWQQKIEGNEADITIEDLKLVIEVDGFPWHMNKTAKDLEKNVIFEKNGYNVLRIRDNQLDKIACDTIVCNVSDLLLEDYNKIIEWIRIRFNCNINILNEFKNTAYYKEIQASLLSVPYNESIEYLFPESKNLWDYERNHPFIPSHFKRGSHTIVSLKCKNNHRYERPIKNLFRITKGTKRIMNCPECPKPITNIQRVRSIENNDITE
jgi:very-short-patch-repair endonuclease